MVVRGLYLGSLPRDLSEIGSDARHEDLNLLVCISGSKNPKFSEVIGQVFTPATVGQSFGPSWTTHWWDHTLKGT